MANTIPVDIEFVLKNMNFQQEAGKMKKGIQGVTDTAQKEADKIQTIYKQMAAGIGVYFSARFLKEFVTQIAQVRGEFQQLEVALETILKSKTEADRLMAQVVNFAATTPFELKDVATGTKQLLAYGFAASETITTMRMLGDVAAGVSAPIGDIIYLYGTLRTQGRAYTRDIMQFTSRGIPIIAQLAEQFGVAESEIQKMVEAGKVGFKEVETAFKSLTNESGMFSNLMEKQSQTITGLYSNFQDAIDSALNGLGKANEGTIADAIKGATTLVENYDKVVDVLKVLVATYGAYKAATIAVAVAENYRATSVVTQAVSNGMIMVNVTRKLTVAQWLQVKSQAALNAVMAINPYVAAATAIAGMIAILTVFRKDVKTVDDYVTDLNNSIDAIGKQEEVDQLINQYETLSGKTKRTADEQKTLNTTIQELGTIFPSAIGQTDEYGKAVDLVTDKLIANSEALRENLKITTGAEIDDAQQELANLIARRDQLLREANTGEATNRTVVTSKLGGSGYVETETISLSPAQIEERRAEINKLTTEIDRLGETVNNSNRKLNELDAADADKVLAPYKALFEEAASYSKDKALEVKANLVALLGAGLGSKADIRIKEQIQAIDSQLGLPTVKRQIEETTTALADAKAKLVEMRSDSSQATSQQIEDQKKLVDDLVSRLELLTGAKQKQDEKIKSLKEQIDQLFKDLQTADEDDRQIIANRILALQREKQLREEIAAQAIKVAENDLLKPKYATAGSIRGTAKDEDGRTLFIGKGEVEAAKKLDLEFEKLEKRIIKIQEKGTSTLLSDVNQMIDAAGFLTQKYGEQLGLTEKQSKVLDDGLKAMSGIADIASGNVIQGAAKLLDAALSLFLKSPEKLSEHFKNVQEQVDKMISSINIATESLGYLGNTTAVDQLVVMAGNLRTVGDEAKRLNNELADSYYGSRTNTRKMIGSYTEMVQKAMALNAEVEKLALRLIEGNLSDDQREAIEAVLNSYTALTGQIDKMTQDITGTTVQSLAESLTEAFAAGEDAAEAWGSKVDEIIKNVIIRQLSADLLSAPLQSAVSALVEDSDNGLTTEEAKRFSEAIQSIYNDAAPALEAAFESLRLAGFDLSSNSARGISGQIRESITEDTATELAGLWNRVALDTRQIRDLTQTNVDHLFIIRQNTANTVAELQAAVKELKDINANTKTSGSRI